MRNGMHTTSSGLLLNSAKGTRACMHDLQLSSHSPPCTVSARRPGAMFYTQPRQKRKYTTRNSPELICSSSSPPRKGCVIYDIGGHKKEGRSGRIGTSLGIYLQFSWYSIAIQSTQQEKLLPTARKKTIQFLPSMMQGASFVSLQAVPFVWIRWIQHSSAPPALLEHPCPPHVPHAATQQMPSRSTPTRPLEHVVVVESEI